MNPKQVEAVIRTLQKETQKFAVPAVTEVSRKNNPFTVLISCVLSLRTKDQTTAQASQRLFALADTPEAMASLSRKQIERAIYPVGFYKTKAKNIKKICQILLDRYNSRVPDTINELLALPNVGRKTAAITMVYGFRKQDYIPTDVHVHVVANRLGWVHTKHPDDSEQALMKVIPKKYWTELNDLLVQFGQNICLTRKPKCAICPITQYCRYYKEVYMKT